MTWVRGLAFAALAAVCGCATPGQRATTVPVTFRVQAEGVGAQERVYIVGNQPALGNWDPAAAPLDRQPDGVWMRTVEVPRGARLEYKLTRGSWATEALSEDRRIQPNRRMEVTGPRSVGVSVPAWRDQVTPVSAVVGDLRLHPGIGGPGIAPRMVAVWLPPGYEQDGARRFPVLYMHDGQNCFDPARAAFGMEWRMDEEATRLLAEGGVAPFIIVAMDCDGARRSEEYGDTEQGAAYRSFVVDVVKPLIDATYRTLPDREHTAVMGSSMGGCVSFLLAWERPDVFGQAACLSPAFFKPVLDRVRRHKGERKPIRVYMDNGGVGLERRLQKGCDRMLALLPKKGFRKDRDFQWFVDPAAEHNEDAWAARVWRPLVFMFGGTSP